MNPAQVECPQVWSQSGGGRERETRAGGVSPSLPLPEFARRHPGGVSPGLAPARTGSGRPVPPRVWPPHRWSAPEFAPQIWPQASAEEWRTRSSRSREGRRRREEGGSRKPRRRASWGHTMPPGLERVWASWGHTMPPGLEGETRAGVECPQVWSARSGLPRWSVPRSGLPRSGPGGVSPGLASPQVCPLSQVCPQATSTGTARPIRPHGRGDPMSKFERGPRAQTRTVVGGNRASGDASPTALRRAANPPPQ